MSTDLTTLPVAHAAPNSLSIMLNPALFEAATGAAKMLARAEGFVPRHLLGKTEACFAVVLQAHDWKLSPLAVAVIRRSFAWRRRRSRRARPSRRRSRPGRPPGRRRRRSPLPARPRRPSR